MFPPSSSEKPFSYPNQNFSKQLCTNHENPSSTQEDLPSFFFPFSSHFTESRNSLQNHLVPQTDQKSPKTRKKKRCDIDKNINSKPNPRKRTGKSDRHSKIYTAHGLRDRRMRLSVQIARKFFDLQDMLGFDKPSKTIEWLFSKSSAAIRDLTVNLPQMNTNGSSISISNCEVDPEMEDKNSGYNSYAKEKREQARARARERTKKLKEPCGSLEENPRNLDDLGFQRPFETKDGKVIPLQDVGMLEIFLGTTSSSASNSAAFDFWKDPSIFGVVDSSNSLMEIFGNSDVTHMIDSYDR